MTSDSDQPQGETSSPSEAGVPRTKGPTRVYDREELSVIWDAGRCTHVAECLRALPEVFNVTKRPWVDISAADAEQIAAAIHRCPTGALKYEAHGEFPDEEPDGATTVRAGDAGPLYMRG